VDSLPTLPAGTNVIGHIIVDSGAISLSAAIPAGTNVIGHILVDSVAGTVTTDPTDRVGRLLGHVTVDNEVVLPALGQAQMASSLPVVRASDEDTLQGRAERRLQQYIGVSQQDARLQDYRTRAQERINTIDRRGNTGERGSIR
jgi:hypothetical protein